MSESKIDKYIQRLLDLGGSRECSSSDKTLDAIYDEVDVIRCELKELVGERLVSSKVPETIQEVSNEIFGRFK